MKSISIWKNTEAYPQLLPPHSKCINWGAAVAPISSVAYFEILAVYQLIISAPVMRNVVIRLMRKKLFILLVLLFTIIYVGTWLAFGKEALLERDVHLVWSDWDLQTYASEAPLFLCTNLTSGKEISHNGRTAQVIYWDECQNDGKFVSIQDSVNSKAANLNVDKDIVIAYAVNEVKTPLLTRNGVGYWFYGTDHFEACDEWIVWGFTYWFVIYERERCDLSEQKNV